MLQAEGLKGQSKLKIEALLDLPWLPLDVAFGARARLAFTGHLITTPPLRGTPPREGNQPAFRPNSPPSEGWQAEPDGVVNRLGEH
jgi:hypothetical protein